MRVGEVLGSLTFRYIAKYVVVLSATVFLLLAVLYALYSRTYFNELSTFIVDELETLELIERGQGLSGLEQYIEDQVSQPSVHRFFYLITDSYGSKVAGDLPADSSYEEFDSGWLGFQVALLDWGEEVDVDFLAKRISLGGRYEALVARDYRDAVDSAGLVLKTLVRAMVATIILGVIGGFLSAAKTLAQVETLNRELSGIIRGSPGQRLDTSKDQGYVRQLAEVVNFVLDQMETLMRGVRNVSDNIAHDLRTPLTRMRNRLSQLRHQVPESGRQEVEQIIEDCDNLLATFNALLRISALESGGQLKDAIELDLATLLADVVELYEPLAIAKEIEIKADSGADCRISGDVDLLFQMFANLVDNAIKYTPQQGKITVSAYQRITESGLTVVIADTGPGIVAAERKNVFRRFYRLESSRSEEPGNGLGLSLAQAIAQYHGGSLELGSNNPGLQVRVKLP